MKSTNLFQRLQNKKGDANQSSPNLPTASKDGDFDESYKKREKRAKSHKLNMGMFSNSKSKSSTNLENTSLDCDFDAINANADKSSGLPPPSHAPPPLPSSGAASPSPSSCNESHSLFDDGGEDGVANPASPSYPSHISTPQSVSPSPSSSVRPASQRGNWSNVSSSGAGQAGVSMSKEEKRKTTNDRVMMLGGEDKGSTWMTSSAGFRPDREFDREVGILRGEKRESKPMRDRQLSLLFEDEDDMDMGPNQSSNLRPTRIGGRRTMSIDGQEGAKPFEVTGGSEDSLVSDENVDAKEVGSSEPASSSLVEDETEVFLVEFTMRDLRPSAKYFMSEQVDTVPPSEKHHQLGNMYTAIATAVNNSSSAVREKVEELGTRLLGTQTFVELVASEISAAATPPSTPRPSPKSFEISTNRSSSCWAVAEKGDASTPSGRCSPSIIPDPTASSASAATSPSPLSKHSASDSTVVLRVDSTASVSDSVARPSPSSPTRRKLGGLKVEGAENSLASSQTLNSWQKKKLSRYGSSCTIDLAAASKKGQSTDAHKMKASAARKMKPYRSKYGTYCQFLIQNTSSSSDFTVNPEEWGSEEDLSEALRQSASNYVEHAMDWILHGDMGSCGKIFVGEGGEGVVEDAAEKKNLGNGGGEGEEEESASKSSVEEPRNLNESDTVHRELLLHMWTSEDVANWLISVGEEEVAQKLKRNAISGVQLLTMESLSLTSQFGLSLPHAAKIISLRSRMLAESVAVKRRLFYFTEEQAGWESKKRVQEMEKGRRRSRDVGIVVGNRERGGAVILGSRGRATPSGEERDGGDKLYGEESQDDAKQKALDAKLEAMKKAKRTTSPGGSRRKRLDGAKKREKRRSRMDTRAGEEDSGSRRKRREREKKERESEQENKEDYVVEETEEDGEKDSKLRKKKRRETRRGTEEGDKCRRDHKKEHKKEMNTNGEEQVEKSESKVTEERIEEDENFKEGERKKEERETNGKGEERKIAEKDQKSGIEEKCVDSSLRQSEGRGAVIAKDASSSTTTSEGGEERTLSQSVEHSSDSHSPTSSPCYSPLVIRSSRSSPTTLESPQRTRSRSAASEKDDSEHLKNKRPASSLSSSVVLPSPPTITLIDTNSPCTSRRSSTLPPVSHDSAEKLSSSTSPLISEGRRKGSAGTRLPQELRSLSASNFAEKPDDSEEVSGKVPRKTKKPGVLSATSLASISSPMLAAATPKHKVLSAASPTFPSSGNSNLKPFRSMYDMASVISTPGSSVGDIPEELKLLRNEILASKVHNVLDSLYGNSIN